MLVSYSNRDEVIVSTLEDEKILIKDYFTDGGRELEDYDREESNAISIYSKIDLRH